MSFIRDAVDLEAMRQYTRLYIEALPEVLSENEVQEQLPFPFFFDDYPGGHKESLLAKERDIWIDLLRAAKDVVHEEVFDRLIMLSPFELVTHNDTSTTLLFLKDNDGKLVNLSCY